MSDRPPPGPLAPLRQRSWLTEAQRKAIHLGFIILPLGLLYEWLPWPRGRGAWQLFLFALVVGAVAVDLWRIHDDRVRNFFREFLGEILREHERFNLLGSTYLLLAALVAVSAFPQTLAAAALGFTVVGDGVGALVGRAYGRHRVFNKSVEGTLAGFAACAAFALFLHLGGHLPIGVGLVGALVAILVELLPIPLDDNLGITLFAGFAMTLLSAA